MVISEETRQKMRDGQRRAREADPTLTARQRKKLIEHNHASKGKTLEEIHGIEKAASIKAQHVSNMTGTKHTDEYKQYMTRILTGRLMTWGDKVSKTRIKMFASGELRLSPRCGSGRGGYREDIGHYVRSSYEHSFAKYLKENGIAYEYEPKTFRLFNTTYTPDFRVFGRYIEIKNEYNVTEPEFLEKMDQLKRMYPEDIPLILVGTGEVWSAEDIKHTLKQFLCIKG